MVAAFRRGLGQMGYLEGGNVAIEYRWAEGQFDRLAAMAADLVGRNVTVIAAFGPPAALAAKAATSTIPVIFVTGFDPVQAGLVASLSRPGGNVTGVHLFLIGLEGKRLGLLRELVPQANLIGLLLNPRSPDSAGQLRALQQAARAVVGQQIFAVEVGSDGEFDTAFAALMHHQVGALIRRRRYILHLAPRSDRQAGRALRDSYHLRIARICRCRWAGELWDEFARRLLPKRRLRGSHSEGCKGGRPAGDAVHEIRVRDQSQNREDAWPRSPARPLCHRR